MNAPIFRWRFGAVEYDEARRELYVAGLAVEMENRPLEVLSLLLRHAGDVVSKQDLFTQVWAGRPTVDHVLSTAVGKLRKVLEAAGERRIVTLPRVGYRFDGPLEKMAVGQPLASALQLQQGQPVPGRSSLVLERLLGRTHGNEVWLARQPRSREARVFKFALDSEHLHSLKREATVARVLHESLGERGDLVRVLDWNFEQPPFFLECEYGGTALPEWAALGGLAALDRPQRINLFVQIAEAVAVAHGVGVLHKDLKPSNVLVAAHGDGWQIRLGDFGNSRLLQPERLAELGITGLGLTVEDGTAAGTALYLAPELIAGQAPSIRSDVYALGVMLYQWLAGDLQRPLAPGWERDIDDPLLCADIASATDVDPQRRMQSVAELAGRLRELPRRHAEHQRRIEEAHAAARLRRVLERNAARRPWLIAAMLMLALGAVGSSLLWWRSEQQRRIAEQQAARAEAAMRFFDQALATLSTGTSGYGHDPTIRQMLEYVSAPGNAALAGDPQVRGDLRTLMGRSWRLLGEPMQGAVEYRAAIDDYAQAFGADHERTLRARYALVRTLAYAQTTAAFAEAEALLAETDRLAGERLHQDNAVALQAALERGIYHLCRQQPDLALQALRRADALQRRIAADDAAMAALIRADIADALRRTGQPQQALSGLDAAAADPLLAPSRIGEVSSALLQAARAHALHDLGRHAEALPMMQAAAEESSRYLGPDDYLTLTQHSALARIHAALGDCAQALPLARDVQRRMLGRFGAQMQATLIETGHLGGLELQCGDPAAGVGHLQQAERQLRLAFGGDSSAVRNFASRLAGAAR